MDRGPKQDAMSIAHHIESTKHDLAHAKTHLDMPENAGYNRKHALKHVNSALKHIKAASTGAAGHPDIGPPTEDLAKAMASPDSMGSLLVKGK